jgi:hypothetical protein
MTIKIRVGSLLLTEARDERLPQEFAAWHQTVRVAPGTYDVFAYLEPEDGTYRVSQLSAKCPGITVSSNFRSHLLGTWGKSDNNRNGSPATAHVGLPTYGLVNTPMLSLLSQAALCDALVRIEWDPCEINSQTTSGKMWRYTWNPVRRPIIIEQPRYGGGLCLAAFEDQRRFRVDADEMAPDDVTKLDISFQHLHNIEQLTVGETAIGWSWSLKRSPKITRLA